MYIIEPIGFVRNNRRLVEDDFWGDITSEIIIAEKFPHDCLDGIEGFSHLEILFYFHLASQSEIIVSSAHPRDNPAFPKVGVFAQRRKARPNLLGCTIVKLINVSGKILTVSGLDALDGTPVIDVKPVLREFMPAEPIIQPQWTRELMKSYWNRKE